MEDCAKGVVPSEGLLIHSGSHPLDRLEEPENGPLSQIHFADFVLCYK